MFGCWLRVAEWVETIRRKAELNYSLLAVEGMEEGGYRWSCRRFYLWSCGEGVVVPFWDESLLLNDRSWDGHSDLGMQVQ